MPQFFVNTQNLYNDSIFITDQEDIKHISKVLRLTIGDNLNISTLDGNIYKTKISGMEKNKIITKIIEKSFSNRKLKTNVTLAHAILKSAKQDILIQKASELGVNTIIPLITKNCVVKFPNEKDKIQKVQRWHKIAIETVKQCERVNLPTVSNIIELKDFLNKNNEFDLKIVCLEREDKLSIKECLKKAALNSIPQNILIVTGPEGGWSDEEIKLFNDYNFHAVTLGQMILRAETATITAVSSIIYEYELN